jgi:hypothetical protein
MSELFANMPAEFSAAGVKDAAQTVPGPVSEELAPLARKFGTYIGFGLLRRKGSRIFNSLVLLDRHGQCCWTYDKLTPMADEMVKGGITPGRTPQAFTADFGKLGAVICFDVNYNEIAELYARQGTELMLFCSAFPGGRLLDCWAQRYNFTMMQSTWYPENRVIDCTGATVGRTSDILPRTTTVVNLNRRVVHMDYNLDKIEKLLNRYGGDVLVEDLRQEAVCVITSLKKGLEVDDLMREFKIERLMDYFDRCRAVRAEHGGLGRMDWGAPRAAKKM